jgi:hypothetical protein
MASNPFFSGRIPQELLDRVEKHVQDTGESKTNILIQALATYLEFPIQLNNSNNSTLEKRLNDLEQQVEQLLRLDRDMSEIKQIVFNRDQIDNNIINNDNEESLNQLSWLEANNSNVITIDNKEVGAAESSDSNNKEWQLLGEMHIAEILKIPNLEIQDETWFKNKLRMLNSSKKEKITVVGFYRFKVIGKENGSKGKIIYEVCERQ